MSKDNNQAIEIMLADINESDLGSVVTTCSELEQVRDEIDKEIKRLHRKILQTMKERKWPTYFDNKTKISVTLSTDRHELVNKKALKLLLNEDQYQQIIKKKSVENVQIVTAKQRSKMVAKDYGKK